MYMYTNKNIQLTVGEYYWQFEEDLRRWFNSESNIEVAKLLRNKKVIRKGNRVVAKEEVLKVMFNTEQAAKYFIGRINSLIREESQ